MSYYKTYEKELRIACESGPESRVIGLLKKGADPNSEEAKASYDNSTPLHNACKHGWLNVVEKLVEEYKCDVNARRSASWPCYSETPLHMACRHGHSEIAKLLIEKYKCNPNVKDSEGRTPLHHAFRNVELTFELVKLLISMNMCDLNAKDNNRKTPLHYACECNRTDLIEELIAHEANTNVTDSDGNTLIHYYIKVNSSKVEVQVISLLLQNHQQKFNLNVKNKDGATPLLSLAGSNSEHVATLLSLLVANGADPNTTDNDGNTLLHVACKAGSLGSVKHFLKFNDDTNAKNKSRLTPLQVTSLWKSEIMQELITHGADPNVTDNDGNTLLHNACQAGRLKSVCLLLNANCDPNAENKSELTPLQVTSINRSDIIQKLITHGADPNVTDSYGNTPLHKACEAESLKSVEYLLNTLSDSSAENKSGLTPLQITSPQMYQVDLNIKNEDGATPLLLLTKSKNYSEHVVTLMSQLVGNGANPNTTDNDGNTLLHVACKAGRIKLVKQILLKLNAKNIINAKNKSGLTPLQVTSPWESGIIQDLITHGASPNVTDSDGNTPLHKVCQESKYNAVDVIKCLLSAVSVCDLNRKNNAGQTPLHLASLAFSRSKSLMKELITHGADTNVTDSDGNTPLHIACQCYTTDYSSAVKCLLNAVDCDPNIKNKAGLTPLQLTTNTTVIRELIRHGADTNDVYKTYGRSLQQPLQPSVKVFIVGNPSVGKSTLTAALRKESSFLRRTFTTSQKVTGVDTKTAGVVPHDFESKEYGYATFYDFAGQREFYGSHAALLKNTIQTCPPIFIIVVDLRENEEEITQTIHYWLVFLNNQCTSVNGKPHVIIVGSHADVLKERGEDPKSKTDYLIPKSNTKSFELAGFVVMDCQYPESRGMTELRKCLKTSCKTLRTTELITFNAHCFYVYLVDKFKESTFVTIEQIKSQIKTESAPGDSVITDFIPHSLYHLGKICDELNDRGHILFLNNLHTIEQSWVVIDKASLLTQVSGSIFAPEHFKQHKVITQCTCSTGVVPLSSIAKSFPDHNPELLVKFLSCLEFCHEISDPEILHCITSEHTACVVSETDHNHGDSERYFLFPALVSLTVPSNIWDDKPEYTQHCGWILQCSTERQEEFFTSRFLQVLLLRIAFSFPLSEGDSLQTHPAIKRNCSIWKNGIFWANEFGVGTLVEVSSDNKAVLVLMRLTETDFLKFIRLRSQIITKILTAANNFCSKIETVESFIDPSKTTRYPFEFESRLKFFSMLNVSKAVVDAQRVVCPTGSIQIEKLLLYEPYAGLGESTVLEIFENQGNSKKVSDAFLSRIAEAKAEEKYPDLFIKMFTPEYIHNARSSVSVHNVLSALKTWRAGGAGTYKSLREKLDKFSIFAERNNLFEACLNLSKGKQRPLSQQNNVETIPFRGNKPILRQLQVLERGEKRVKVIESIAAQWKHLALALGFEAPVIDYLSKDFSHDCLGAATEVLAKWLNGEGDSDQPITWDTLIQCLIEAGKLVLAEDLTEVLKDDPVAQLMT